MSAKFRFHMLSALMLFALTASLFVSYSSGSRPITNRSAARAFACVYNDRLRMFSASPKRLLGIDDIQLRRGAELVVRFRHFARAACLIDVELGRLNRPIGERQGVERGLHFEAHLTFERRNLVRHRIPLGARLRDAAGLSAIHRTAARQR